MFDIKIWCRNQNSNLKAHILVRYEIGCSCVGTQFRIKQNLLHYKIFEGCTESTCCNNFHAYLSYDFTFWVGDTESKLHKQVMQTVCNAGRHICCR